MADDDNGHLRIVPLQTRTKTQQQMCVLKLRELLAQAEQGKYRDLIIIAQRDDGSFLLHFTSTVINNSFAFLGALQMMIHQLASSVQVSKL